VNLHGEPKLAAIEKRPLPAPNAPTITEGDRSRVYGAIGKELNDILSGKQSYYQEGVQKHPREIASDLDNFVASVKDLGNHVNDPRTSWALWWQRSRNTPKIFKHL
jgi:hypothetical protein